MLDRYIQQVQLLPELTLADVGRYLSSKQPTDVIGYVANCMKCLLAEAVKHVHPDKGLEGINICDVGFIFLDAHYNEYVLPLTNQPVNMLMYTFDLLDRASEPITKQRLLTYLAEHRPELLDGLQVSDPLGKEVQA